MWVPEDGHFLCRGCHRVVTEAKKAKQEACHGACCPCLQPHSRSSTTPPQERDKLRLAKMMKFGDKVSKAPALRRLDSGRAWEGSFSFTAPLALSEAVEVKLLVWEMSRQERAAEGNAGSVRAPGEGAMAAAAAPRSPSPEGSTVGAPDVAPAVPADAPLPVFPKTAEQRSRLAQALSGVLLFRKLSPVQYEAMVDAMFERPFIAGESIIQQGDLGDNFYVVESGSLDVFVAKPGAPPQLVMSYGTADTFGELALLNNARRAATVTARGCGALWALGRVAFARVLVDVTQRQRATYEQFLQAVPLLAGLDPYDRSAMADCLVPVAFADGETVIRQGDQGDAFFLVLEGAAVALVASEHAPGGQKEVMAYQQGMYFGEVALLRDEPRKATVAARGELRVARMEVDAFRRILARPLKAALDRAAMAYSRPHDEKFVR